MAHPATKLDVSALTSSEMRCVSLLVPKLLLDEVNRAAFADDPSAPNRSSWMRRALIDRLKREAAR